jgi:N-methylhydantoinase A/oxoprolinase/acetone carboxylase beta subunit
LHDAFETAYRELFGATVADGVPQIVGVRITALGQAMNSSLPRISEPRQSLTFKPRLVCIGDGRDWVSVDVYHRSGLTPELRQLGPAIIQDEDSSMLIEVGWKYWVDVDGVVHATQQTKVEP